jgi:ectoine hydroxylase-related dioxygenase (phytanoyl-CoA dioxygenase family)
VDASEDPGPLDESAIATVDAVPLAARFQLRSVITSLQAAFLERHGFLVFARVATPVEVARILEEVDRLEAALLAAGKEAINGVPVWFGRGPDGRRWLQRTGFASVLSEYIRDFVRDERFEPIRTLIGAAARVGDREKDGVVFNRYFRAPGSLRPSLAWHTDALRDVFYNRALPGPMLNVGLHFDRVRPEDGGLRLLPGTHRQGLAGMLFRKIHFVSNRADRRELAVETWPGDLTVHDGRMWHRVAASPRTGWESVRRSLYVPYVVDAYQPKDESSPTPAYLRLFSLVMRARGAL